ncbi:malonyl-CoA decarboxylase [Variovorax sp. PCZ-1]|uniref:malonyl-CoA decarboxylase n=1 Tax=Variovorax sp. PCZ-1 TaxID=2835533 RepID=UPI001BCF2B0F|nr:malonyl-CoA decarboxylase [Variovorax sp. PCZ-1]MBS7807863.1 malonyl-CoA decarboxylase [Variovorax sp. PCZ-1]
MDTEPLAQSTSRGSQAGSWLRRHAVKLGWQKIDKTTLISKEKQHIAGIDIAQSAIDIIATTDHAMRSTNERLKASLKQKHEALSPRVLRRTLLELKAVADPQVSEVEGGRRAQGVAKWYAKASSHEQRDMWLLMSEQFAPDAAQLRKAREQYESALISGDLGLAEVAMHKSLTSPRKRLLQRFAAFPEGMRFLIEMRTQWLPELKKDRRLLALDAELEVLLSTWFDVAFLELRRISWDSPASLLEKLIRYEAVHDIKGWMDLKNRLDSDRRCYGFFHAKLPDEPLIFVEVALGDEMASGILPLLDEQAKVHDLKAVTTAIFYSISNTQTGLRGVGFGDSLIKRVVETLKTELPKLKVFATLSPIPGFRAWLTKIDAPLVAQADANAETVKQELTSRAAQYLAQEMRDGQPLDAVAKFHLGNGSRVERINWAADPSAKGTKQSFGLMVNYLYDLKQIDKHRQSLAAGKIACSADIKKLLN